MVVLHEKLEDSQSCHDSSCRKYKHVYKSSNNRQDISIQTSNANLMVAQEENLGSSNIHLLGNMKIQHLNNKQNCFLTSGEQDL